MTQFRLVLRSSSSRAAIPGNARLMMACWEQAETPRSGRRGNPSAQGGKRRPFYIHDLATKISSEGVNLDKQAFNAS